MHVSSRLRGAALATVLVAAAQPARAQSVAQMFGTDVKNTVGDIWAVWTAPLNAGPIDWLSAGGAVAGSAALSPLDDDVDRWAVRQRDRPGWNFLDPVREGGVAFAGKTITPVAVGVLAFGLIVKSERLQEGLFGCVSSYASTSIARSFVIYPLVARTRPDTTRGPIHTPPASQGDQYHFSFPGTSDWGRHAFPGGHAANVAACASFLTNRFAMGIVEPVIWAAVAGVGTGRILDRRHWTSDQVFGTLFGIGAGRVVASRSSHRASRANAAGRHDNDDSFVNNLIFEPSSIDGGMNIGWRRAF
jgi:membrane-associated phospholipid phosphatase